ncbi:MAG: GcvT family protein [Kineosporiaceae bacterium]|nr:GcvT family protein [Kineosporiaceae bacterium]
MNPAEAADRSAHRVPQRARVIVIGGGVIGTSVAYHLAEQGWGADIVLLERDKLTSGTTWHAAGLMVTFGSMSHTSTRLRQYTRELYARLEAETGQSTGFRPVGFLEVAADADRLEEYRRVSAFNRHCGVDVHEISPREVAELWPLARTDDLLAGFYVEQDGRANPVDVTMALAKGARQRGARLIEGVAVTSVIVEHAGTPRARVRGVRTLFADGTTAEIECEVVVNCAGMWARQLGEANGVALPLQAAEHYYLITEPIEGVHAGLPVLEDPGTYGYIREETGGLMVGLFEGVAAPWSVPAVPQDFSFGQITPDWDRMGPYVEAAMSRVPATLDAQIRTFFCGPESFTPDLAPLFGEVPEVANYYVAAGLNSIGILTGGGIGRSMAHWIVAGEPDIDITGMDVARLQPFQTTPSYRRDRTAESLGLVYACHYPNRDKATARGAKRSPVHDRLAAAGAHFRDVSGWEGADWYGETPSPETGPLTFGRPAWFAHWAAEHRAVREEVGLMDMSFMAKFLVQGRDAGAVLDHLSAGHVDVDLASGPPGRGQVTYTQWLDEAAHLRADLTVTKLDAERFWVVASDTAHRRVEAMIRRAIGFGRFADAHATVTDVTSGWAQLNVQGPRSRELLAGLTSADLSTEAFPFRAAGMIDLGFARVLCLRITYLGELGYELYVPAEHAVEVHDRIVAAGSGSGRGWQLRHVGLRSLASLRLEKAYRDYGHDIDNTDTVLEAGLGFAVALHRPDGTERDFIGRDAVARLRAAGTPASRLVQVLLRTPEPLLDHGEVVLRNGSEVGYLRAASYGHTLGGAVGLAMLTHPDGDPLTQGWLDEGTWHVDIAGRCHPATVSLRPLYDPTSSRVRA